MAVFVGSALGNMRGKLGNMYARIRRGKTIWSILPDMSNVKSTEEQAEIRRRFEVAIRFCRGILKDNDLKAIWSKDLKGFSTFYHKCVSANYKYVEPTKPSTNNIVSPEGFMIDFGGGNLTGTNFTASVPAINSYTYLDEQEVDVSFVGTLMFSGRLDEKLEPFIVTPVRKHITSYNFGSTYSLTIPLDAVQQKMVSLYESMVLYLTLITKDSNGKPIQHSQTLSFLNS